MTVTLKPKYKDKRPVPAADTVEHWKLSDATRARRAAARDALDATLRRKLGRHYAAHAAKRDTPIRLRPGKIWKPT